MVATSHILDDENANSIRTAPPCFHFSFAQSLHHGDRWLYLIPSGMLEAIPKFLLVERASLSFLKS